MGSYPHSHPPIDQSNFRLPGLTPRGEVLAGGPLSPTAATQHAHLASMLSSTTSFKPIPWADTPLVYQLKFRLWVQPYDPHYHTQLRRATRPCRQYRPLRHPSADVCA